MNKKEAVQISAELIKALLAAGWGVNQPDGAKVGERVGDAIVACAKKLIEYSDA